MKQAAIYARVSSDRQKENHTIASQTAALLTYAETQQYMIPPEWRFEDEGYSGATLARPVWNVCEISRPRDRSRQFSSIRRTALVAGMPTRFCWSKNWRAPECRSFS